MLASTFTLRVFLLSLLLLNTGPAAVDSSRIEIHLRASSIAGHDPSGHGDHGGHVEHGHEEAHHGHEQKADHGHHEADHGHDEAAHGHDEAPPAYDYGAAHGHDEVEAAHGRGTITTRRPFAHEQDEHGHQEGDHGHHEADQGARSVAVGLITAALMIPIVVSMALSGGAVAEVTMKMLDSFTSIFLAVLWFNAFSQLIETSAVRRAFPHADVVVAMVQVVGLYVIALAVAYIWRDKTMKLTTFCGCGAHYIAFAGISASGNAQHALASSAEHGYEPVVSFGFVLLVIAFLGLISVCAWYFWRKDKGQYEKMQEAVEELELDILGLVVSFLITQAVRHAITGRYPPLHFMFIQETVDMDNPHYVHQRWQRLFMLGWSVSLTVLAGVTLPALNKFESRGYWTSKAIHVLKVVLIMLVAWGYLLWAQWEFYEALFHGDEMFGHMLFAMLATFVCLALLYILASNQPRFSTPQARQTMNITTTGISLVAAWSWEHCFNLAFDVIGHEYQVGYGGLVPKLVMAVVIPLVMLPPYVQHIKTRVVEMEEQAHHAHQHGAHAGGETEHGEHKSHDGSSPEHVESGAERDDSGPLA